LEPEALGHQDQVSPTWKKIGFHRDKVVLPNTLFVFRNSFIQKCSISSVLSEITYKSFLGKVFTIYLLLLHGYWKRKMGLVSNFLLVKTNPTFFQLKFAISERRAF
jgi:hypothetical protein